MDYEIVETSILGTNTYLIYGTNNECVVVDCGGEAEKIYKKVTDKGYKISYILLTHTHFDHSGGVASLKNLTGAKVYMPKKEVDFLTTNKNLAANVGETFDVFTPDVLLEGGENLLVAGYDVKVIATPGHTVGSLTYLFDKENVMLVGDTLFKGSYGRVDLPTGSFVDMLKSQDLLFGFKKDYLLLTGHGESTTLFSEKGRW